MIMSGHSSQKLHIGIDQREERLHPMPVEEDESVFERSPKIQPGFHSAFPIHP